MRSRLKRFARRHYNRQPRQNGLQIWKKILKDLFDKFRRKSRCLGAKIVTKARLKLDLKLKHRIKYKKLKECQDFQEPLFGFRVKVTLVENEACVVGETCTEEGLKIDRHFLLDRQTGENFLSAAPVHYCRTSRCTF